MKKSKASIFLRTMIGIYYRKHVSRSAAELAYFFTLSIFPMLICLYAMLGNFLPSAENLILTTEGFIPEGTLNILTDYIEYISSHNSAAMLTGGLILMATSSAGAFRSLHNIMGEIQGGSRFSGAVSLIVSFLFSLVFLAVIYFSIVVMITGGWFFDFLSQHIDLAGMSGAWNWVRFLLLFLLLLVIIYGLYRITAPRGTEHTLSTGAVLATVALVGISILFSWFIGMSSRYPLIYGSLASIIVLMIWLYLCGNILILGNAVNVVLREMRSRKSIE